MNLKVLREANEFLKLLEDSKVKKKVLSEIIEAKEAAVNERTEAERARIALVEAQKAELSLKHQVEEIRDGLDAKGEELEIIAGELVKREEHLRAREDEARALKISADKKQEQLDQELKKVDSTLENARRELARERAEAVAVKEEYKAKLQKLKETIGG